MEKIEQKSVELDIAEAQGDIIYKENKTLARLSWLKGWSKNPKLATTTDLKRLKTQITTLGTYKPIVICLEGNRGLILGGHQRLLVLSELREEEKKKNLNNYEYVWVSVVNAKDDYEKLKYALSDNEQIGKYDVDKLKEVLAPQVEQGNLFDGFTFNFEEGQSIETLAKDLTQSREELKFKGIKKQLKELGINDETVKALETMTTYNKINEELEDVDIQGCVTGQKFPLLFWVDDEVLYEQLQKVFDTGYKDRHNTERLIEYTETVLGEKLPVKEDKIGELVEKIKKVDKQIADFKELDEDWKELGEKRAKYLEEAKSLIGIASFEVCENSGQTSIK